MSVTTSMIFETSRDAYEKGDDHEVVIHEMNTDTFRRIAKEHGYITAGEVKEIFEESGVVKTDFNVYTCLAHYLEDLNFKVD